MRKILIDTDGCILCTRNIYCNNPIHPRGLGISPIFIILSHPTEIESLDNIPAIGERGKLLENIVQALFKVASQECYITYHSKCFALKAPTKKEYKACTTHLQKEIELLPPKYILSLSPQYNKEVGLNPYSFALVGGKVYTISLPDIDRLLKSDKLLLKTFIEAFTKAAY
jgi:uracil-DNA glycosylase family 4